MYTAEFKSIMRDYERLWMTKNDVQSLDKSKDDVLVYLSAVVHDPAKRAAEKMTMNFHIILI